MVAVESITLIIASVGACIASVVYSFKHVKTSECWGSKCVQDTSSAIQESEV